MKLELCSEHHEPVCYAGEACPVCAWVTACKAVHLSLFETQNELAVAEKRIADLEAVAKES